MGRQSHSEEQESETREEEPKLDPIPEPMPDPPQTPAPSSLPLSLASELNEVRESVSLSLGLVQDNLSLAASKVAAMTDAQERGWTSVEHTLDQMKAIIELATEFLTGMDERIDKLIGATAALIKVQQQLAAALVAQNPDTLNQNNQQ